MQLILLQKVTNLGNLGDLVDVKPGYGRNFLVPQARPFRPPRATRPSSKPSALITKPRPSPSTLKPKPARPSWKARA